MSVTAVQIMEFEKEYLQTSGINFNFYFSKTRKKWVAYTVEKRFEDPDIFNLFIRIIKYIQDNRIETRKINYQFKYKFSDQGGNK